MAVDEPRQHSTLVQLDHPRIGTDEPRDLVIRADRQDAIMPDGYRCRMRPILVNRPDYATSNYQIGNFVGHGKRGTGCIHTGGER
jgi:hypothetical protein